MPMAEIKKSIKQVHDAGSNATGLHQEQRL
jgi:hypothetical protein